MTTRRASVMALASLAGYAAGACAPPPAPPPTPPPPAATRPAVPLPPGDRVAQTRGLIAYLLKSPWCDAKTLAQAARLQAELGEKAAAQSTLKKFDASVSKPDEALKKERAEVQSLIQGPPPAPKAPSPPPARDLLQRRLGPLETAFSRATDPAQKAGPATMLALTHHQLGDRDAYARWMEKAAEAARMARATPAFDTAIGRVAVAQAAVGDLEGAVTTAREIGDDRAWGETILKMVRAARGLLSLDPAAGGRR